jgi:transglutaminase-like putative cysteine protease
MDDSPRKKDIMNFRERIRSAREWISAKKVAVAAAILFAFGLGVVAGRLWEPAPATFHDIMMSDPDDLPELITPGDGRVRSLAQKLQTPENAYVYVRDKIRFDPSLPALPAGDIIAEGKASCLGKAIVLCSLYRAMGIPATDVRVVTGELSYPGSIIDHAWVDMEYQGECIQQDTTDLIGIFRFDEFKGTEYTRSFVRKEAYVFNDRDFAIISRLNMMKGSGHPPMQ